MITLPKLSPKTIQKKLRNRKLENTDSLKLIEQLLIKKRKFVFKMPEKNTPVILLYSGGLDSTTALYLLLKQYKLIVYPLVLYPVKTYLNPLAMQSKSIKFYSKLFKAEFPRHFQKPFLAKFHPPMSDIKKKIIKHLPDNPQFLLNHYSRNTKTINLESTGQITTMALIALDYAQLILAKNNHKINCFFSACTASDGISIRHQTLTSHRSAMLNLCLSNNDFANQFTSVYIEKELNFFASKKDVINFAGQNGLNLRHTCSCYQNRFIHCGLCPGCQSRQYWFKCSNYQDKTHYLKQRS